MSAPIRPLLAFFLLSSFLLPLVFAETSFRFTAPPLQCSLLTVGAADTDTAFLGTFFAADEAAATRCVTIGGPQVMVVASGGDPGATTSNLLVPTRVGNTINRRLLSIVGGSETSARGWFSSILLRSFAHLTSAPAPLLGRAPLHARRPITGLFEEEEAGPLEDVFQGGSFGWETGGGSPSGALQGGPSGVHLRGGRAMLQGSVADAGGRQQTSFFTCPSLPSAFWNVSGGPFPDPRSLPSSLVNGSFLLSAACQNKLRSTLFLYNRCQSAIPLTFQIMQSSTEYCDLYNFQRYFSNTLFVRVIVMVGGVLACVLVVFSLGCLIGICRNRRLARARVRRNLAHMSASRVGGGSLLRFVPPGGVRARVVDVPMYEVNLDPGKETGGDEACVVGKDGRSFVVVIQPGMSENPSVETLAMSGAISIATEDVRHSSRVAAGAESSQAGRVSPVEGSGESSQVVRAVPVEGSRETRVATEESADGGSPAIIEMLPVRDGESR
ncbi:hypothetical protein KFL_004070070 [Klebsormidium nitens]|uniref:Transmembrane protein n=1 Tax=Klebsormidium nitens TaxID=105231 RepID=A0A1Y1IB44_KLENI|nr:hypothetical protein KFL_004070070 [Klebsormidium nitens]|eukprot:GAQ88185.1 hypothetical protein KFL_004070070 [Klebsormidium nitens]